MIKSVEIRVYGCYYSSTKRKSFSFSGFKSRIRDNVVSYFFLLNNLTNNYWQEKKPYPLPEGVSMANEKQLNKEILDKEIYEKVKDLRAIDDALFRLLASRKDVCQEILRNLLDDDNLEVIEVTPQDEMISLFRGVVLDALCKLSDGSTAISKCRRMTGKMI